jgi:hypothetical protein
MSADPPNEHGETWFGSGLRAHLGIKPEPEPVDDPELVVEPEPEPAPTVAEEPASDANDAAAEALLAELAERERILREAEQDLAERERHLAAEWERLDQSRSALDARSEEAYDPSLSVRDALRELAERETDRLWRTIDEALEARFEDGRPDFHARLAAIKLLLGEAYDVESAVAALPARDEQPEDELAARRAERFQL